MNNSFFADLYDRMYNDNRYAGSFYDTRNYLDKSKYLFLNDNGILHQAFLTGVLHNKSENDGKLFMIVIRVLNREDKILLYNNISYHPVLTIPLMYYLVNRNIFSSRIFKEPGTFLSLIDKSCFNSGKNYLYFTEDQLSYIYKGLKIIKDYDYTVETETEILLNETIGFVNSLCLNSDVSQMSKLVELAFFGKYSLYLKEIMNSEVINKKLSCIPDSGINNSISLLNGCVFLTTNNNIDVFINSIRDKGFNINAGVKKHRGSVNSMNNFLNLIDQDFRNSLYLHNLYHVRHDTLNQRNALIKKHFSFKNIHMNIGDVRWYSTKINANKSSKVVNITTKSLINRFRNMHQYDIFNQLSEYFINTAHNEDTQRNIEEYLLEHSKSLFDNKREVNKQALVDYSLFSAKFIKFLDNKTNDLNLLIDNTRNRVYKSIPKTNKEKNLYYFNKILNIVSNTYVISIIYGRLLLISNINNKLNNNELAFYLDLGRDLVNNYHYCLYTNDKNVRGIDDDFSFSVWKDNNKNIIDVYNNNDDKFTGMLGGLLVKWMLDLDLIERDWVKLSKIQTGILIPSKDVKDVIDIENNNIHPPRRMPMIVKPKPYYREKRDNKIIDKLGGYLLNDIKYTESLVKPKWDMLETSLVEEKNLIYSLANNVNSVPYKINKDVLDFVRNYGNIYNLLEIENYEHLIDKSKLNMMEHTNLESFLSKKILCENILGLATAYSNVNEFYLPIRIEFRGRLNCISDYLNYQSNDLAKSLLLFSRGEKLYKTNLKGLGYFKAYGANCYGNKMDKKSWNDRINWVNVNESDIINFYNGKLISEADNKLLFIAFCFEYNKMYKSYENIENEYFETCLPIKLDATCNGYQHVALLSGDGSLSKELNLNKSTWNDLPKDFYGFIGFSLVDWAKNKAKSTPISDPDWESYDRLSHIKLVRDILKGPVMTWAYNISPMELVKKIKTLFIPVKDLDSFYLDFHYEKHENISKKQSIIKNKKLNREIYFNEWFKYTKDNNILLKGKDFSVIRLGLEKVLNSDLFKIRKLTTYLDRIARILTELELVINWGTPNGVSIRQSYLQTKETKLKPFSSSKRVISLTIPDPIKKFNKRKQLRSFRPNLIHSLDASSLALLVDLYFNSNCNSVKNIFTIHDCFAVTANNVDTVMDLLKLVYTKIYSDKQYLRELDKHIRGVIIHNYKESFNEQKLEINVNDKIYKYPSVEEVLGMTPFVLELKHSSYIMH